MQTSQPRSVSVNFLVLVFFLLGFISTLKLSSQQETSKRRFARQQFAATKRKKNGTENDWLPKVGQQQQEPLEFGVVVDCGSSGTRATIYSWPKGTQRAQLADNIKPLERGGKALSLRIRPGLASVRDNPNYASDYMRPIMQFASENVPVQVQPVTPIYFMGTAGMRLLTLKEQQVIMEDLRNDLGREYAFRQLQTGVISGVQEGAFQWLSIGAIARRLGKQFALPQGGAKSLFLGWRWDQSRRQRRMALVEMGGASSQVAFETGASLDELLESRLKHQPAALRAYRTSRFELDLHDDREQKVSLVSVSFLGFGSDTARLLAVDLLLRDSLKYGALLVGRASGAALVSPLTIEPNATLLLQDPCLPAGAEESLLKPLELVRGQSKTIGYNLRPGQEKGPAIKVKLVGRGNYAKCQHLLNRLIIVARREQTTCKAQAEPMGARAPPSPTSSCESSLIGTSFVPWTQFQFVGLGELVFTSARLLNETHGAQFDGLLFRRQTARFCASSWRNIQAQYAGANRNEVERRRLMLTCFKASWVLTWLVSVLQMPLVGRGSFLDLSTADQLNGAEIDWKLGAIIAKTIERSGEVLVKSAG